MVDALDYAQLLQLQDALESVKSWDTDFFIKEIKMEIDRRTSSREAAGP